MKINYTSERLKFNFEVENGGVTLLHAGALDILEEPKRAVLVDFLAFLSLNKINVGNDKIVSALETTLRAHLPKPEEHATTVKASKKSKKVPEPGEVSPA